jgi:hypothetical protein
MKFPKMRTQTAMLIVSAALLGFAPWIEARFVPAEFANPACSAQSPCSLQGKLPDPWVPDAAPEVDAVSPPPNTMVAAAGPVPVFGSASLRGFGSLFADAIAVHP